MNEEAVTSFIDDRAVRDSVLAYGYMLKVTKELFGEENLTEAVMVKAIEAASYAAYGAIMGPKEIDRGSNDRKGAWRTI